MKLSRIIIGTVSGALLGLTPLSLAAPAHALGLVTSASLSATPTTTTYGKRFSLEGKVTGVDPATGQTWSVLAGTVTLQIQTPTQPTWTTIATDTSPESYRFSVKARSNASYQAVYSGGSYLVDTYTPSVSAPVAVQVRWKVALSRPGRAVVGHTTPGFKKKKVFIQRKAGGWKPYKVIRSDKHGRWEVILPAKAGRKTLYRITIRGTDSYARWRTKLVAQYLRGRVVVR